MQCSWHKENETTKTSLKHLCIICDIPTDMLSINQTFTGLRVHVKYGNTETVDHVKYSNTERDSRLTVALPGLLDPDAF